MNLFQAPAADRYVMYLTSGLRSRLDVSCSRIPVGCRDNDTCTRHDQIQFLGQKTSCVAQRSFGSWYVLKLLLTRFNACEKVVRGDAKRK